jgi:hypothetical protein
MRWLVRGHPHTGRALSGSSRITKSPVARDLPLVKNLQIATMSITAPQRIGGTSYLTLNPQTSLTHLSANGGFRKKGGYKSLSFDLQDGVDHVARLELISIFAIGNKKNSVAILFRSRQKRTSPTICLVHNFRSNSKKEQKREKTNESQVHWGRLLSKKKVVIVKGIVTLFTLP